MIDVKKLTMTADKSRYIVDRDELEALIDRLEAAGLEVEFWKRADKQHREERDALAAKLAWYQDEVEQAIGGMRGVDGWGCVVDLMCKLETELRRQADPDLCVDEGCPHHGTPHVCINRQAEEAL